MSPSCIANAVSHRRSCPFVVCRGCFSPVYCAVSVSPLDPSSFPSLSFFRSLADVTSIARYSFRRAFLPFCLSTQLFQPRSRYGLSLTPCMIHQALPHCSSFPYLFQTFFLPRPRKALRSHGRGQHGSKQNEDELGRREYSLVADCQSRSRIDDRISTPRDSLVPSAMHACQSSSAHRCRAASTRSLSAKLHGSRRICSSETWSRFEMLITGAASRTACPSMSTKCTYFRARNKRFCKALRARLLSTLSLTPSESHNLVNSRLCSVRSCHTFSPLCSCGSGKARDRTNHAPHRKLGRRSPATNMSSSSLVIARSLSFRASPLCPAD